MDVKMISLELDTVLSHTDEGDTHYQEQKVKEILENVWKFGMNKENAQKVLMYLVNIDGIPKKATVTVKNFIIVFFHFLAYCIYCTEKNLENLLGKNLACMRFKSDGGKKEVFKQMKLFYDSMRESQRFHYDNIILGLYIDVFSDDQTNIHVTQKEIFDKGVKKIIKNMKTDSRNKLKAGVWKTEDDYDFKLMYNGHREIFR